MKCKLTFRSCYRISILYFKILKLSYPRSVVIDILFKFVGVKYICIWKLISFRKFYLFLELRDSRN